DVPHAPVTEDKEEEEEEEATVAKANPKAKIAATAKEEEEEEQATVAKAEPKAKTAAKAKGDKHKAAIVAMTDLASGAEAEATKKRPASFDAEVMVTPKKRPASASDEAFSSLMANPMCVDYSDLVALTQEKKRATTRGAFTTRAYKGTLTRAKRLGIEGQPQNDWGKAAYQQAAAVWDGLILDYDLVE
ncbi:hypothetical protein N9L68_07910, partial [bacterium]|nr:hypothetical protein [bacterium]